MPDLQRAREADRLQRLIGRYRDLLAEADANDDLLLRGIEREIESLEGRLRQIDAKRLDNVPALIASRRGPGPSGR